MLSDKKLFCVKNGTIYIQKFPHGKLYVGQTIRKTTNRFIPYTKNEGNNPHHTNALKKYGYENVEVLTFVVPQFLLDSVEKSLIKYWNTTDRRYGYNKTDGGANGKPNEETREKMRIINSDGRHKGENNVMFGKKHKPETIEIFKVINKGERNPMFGRSPTKEFVENARKTGSEHHSYGKKASEETKRKQSIARTGQKRTQETKDNISKAKKGAKHPKAKAVYVYGNWYGSCGVASDALRFIFGVKSNFIKQYVHQEKYPEIFFA
jgi:group I intron endonuclease